MKSSQNKYEKFFIYSFPIFLAIFTYSQLKGLNILFARTWIWLFLAFGIAYSSNRLLLKGKALRWGVIYSFVVFLNFITGDGYFTSIGNVLLEVVMAIYCILISRYICFEKQKVIIKLTTLLTIAIVAVTCLLTIRMIMVIPEIVRQIVVILNRAGGEVAVLEFYRLGVCEYSFPHALPILIPPLVLWILNPEKKILRLVAIPLLALIFYFLYLCDVGTPLFVGGFALIGSFLVSTKSLKRSIYRVVIVTMLTAPFLNKAIMLSSLETVENMIVEDNLIKKKIVDIEASIRYDKTEGAADDRATLYDKSIDGFTKSPLWGTNDAQIIGGHSALLDRFCTLGLLGAIPFVLLLYFHLKFIFVHLPEKTKSFYLLSAIAFILIIAGKNMNNIYTWIFVSIISPCFLLLCDIKDEKNHNSVKIPLLSKNRARNREDKVPQAL